MIPRRLYRLPVRVRPACASPQDFLSEPPYERLFGYRSRQFYDVSKRENPMPDQPASPPVLTLEFERKDDVVTVHCYGQFVSGLSDTFYSKTRPTDPEAANGSSSISAIVTAWIAWVSAPSWAFTRQPAPQAARCSCSTSASASANSSASPISCPSSASSANTASGCDNLDVWL